MTVQGIAEGQTMAEKTAAISTATTYTAATGGGVFGMMNFNEWIMAGSFVLAVLTYATNVYFKFRMEKIVRDKK